MINLSHISRSGSRNIAFFGWCNGAGGVAPLKSTPGFDFHENEAAVLPTGDEVQLYALVAVAGGYDFHADGLQVSMGQRFTDLSRLLLVGHWAKLMDLGLELSCICF